MKKLFTGIAIFVSATGFAQNVGIGEPNPTESKLQVKATDSAALLIQNTGIPNGTKTALFYKSDGNYSGSIATVKTAAQTYRMGLYTFGGSQASALQERLSVLDNGNVGIGTINPTAKLEVAGTVKIADGTQGADKVLVSDATGNATWQTLGSKAGYKYCKQITTVGAGSFTIPAGVTEVMVELWGAGSGGVSSFLSGSVVVSSYYFGGTSGGYATTVQTVTPGYNLTYTIGTGSDGQNYDVTISNGGPSTVTFANGYITANGGGGHPANANYPGFPIRGISNLPNFLTLHGNVGLPLTFRGEQTSSTEFWKIQSFGDGGNAVGILNGAVRKGETRYFLNGNFSYKTYNNVGPIIPPSSGGQSGDGDLSGGDGMLLIWYN